MHFMNIKTLMEKRMMMKRGGRQVNEKFFDSNNGSKGLAKRIAQGRSTGSLNLSNVKLDKISLELMEQVQNGVGEDEQWWNVAGLTELKFSDNEIADVEEEAFGPVQETVEVVLIDNNRLAQFPIACNVLFNLKKLVLSSNHIRDIPDNLDLPNLRILNISHNEIEHMPECIGRIHGLEVLNLSNNRIQAITFSLPGRLQKLNLRENAIEHVDEGAFTGLRNLKVLEIGKNKIRKIPKSLEELRMLQILDAEYNCLEGRFGCALPQSDALDQVIIGFNRLTTLEDLQLDRCPNLSVLKVCENKLQSLPEKQLLNCKNLKIFDISVNDLTDIPSYLGYMPKLQGLNVIGNPVRGIRYSIMQASTDKLKAFLRTRGTAPEILQNMDESKQGGRPVDLAQDNELIREALAHLRVSGTLKLSGLLANVKDPDALAHVLAAAQPLGDSTFMRGKPLADLHLDSNRFSVFPRALVSPMPYFAAILALKLDDNQLESLGANEIAFLPNLQRLSLRNNHIKQFLEDVRSTSQLPVGLVHLDLRQNQLRQVPPMLCRCFPNLQELMLGFNNISSDEPDLIHLSKLKVLDLSNNKVPGFPGATLTMRELENLNVENNCITNIPNEIALNRNLKTLLLAGNPQRSIRAHVISEGSPVVIQYLRDRCTQPFSPTEAKSAVISNEQEQDISRSISQLEQRLESDFSLSSVQRNSLRKELARQRSNLARINS